MNTLRPTERLAIYGAAFLACIMALAMTLTLKQDVACHSVFSTPQSCDLQYHDPGAYPLGEDNPMMNGQDN
jgi:hypothetical protein